MAETEKRAGLTWWADRGLTALMVLLVIFIAAGVPLADVSWGGPVLHGLFSLILVAGVVAVWEGREVRFLVAGVAFGSLTVRWVGVLAPGHGLLAWDLWLSFIFMAFLAVVTTMRVFRAGPVTIHRISGAVAVYLLAGLSFAMIYALAETMHPGSFLFSAERDGLGFEALRGRMYYFSFVTLTTVGYGDITAISPGVRTLVILEGLMGQLFPAVLIARLVALQVSEALRK